MGVLTTILIFVAVLGLLVLVHELGHFIAARWSGMAVDEFGVGFPPRLLGKRIGKTLYSINWIPVGGFVKIKGVAGDDPAAGGPADDDSFASKPMWRRFLVLFAGIGMNALLAVVLLTIVLSAGMRTSVQEVRTGAIISNESIVVTGTLPNSPAARAGIEAGDRVTAVNGVETNDPGSIAESTAIGEETSLEITREDETMTVVVTPEVVSQENGEVYTGIGIGMDRIVTARYTFPRAVVLGFVLTWELTVAIVNSLVDIVASIASGDTEVAGQFAGPVGIAVITGEVAELGIVPLLQFAALLSINLALFNLLPLPALDGGRIAFLVGELILRRPVSPRTEAIIHNTGFALLLLLVLLITVQDISQFIR